MLIDWCIMQNSPVTIQWVWDVGSGSNSKEKCTDHKSSLIVLWLFFGWTFINVSATNLGTGQIIPSWMPNKAVLLDLARNSNNSKRTMNTSLQWQISMKNLTFVDQTTFYQHNMHEVLATVMDLPATATHNWQSTPTDGIFVTWKILPLVTGGFFCIWSGSALWSTTSVDWAPASGLGLEAVDHPK